MGQWEGHGSLALLFMNGSDGLILPDTSKVVSYDQCCLVLGF
jgi:hypothetical protein